MEVTLTPQEALKAIKKEIRVWEKSFAETNGRKPEKKDVLADKEAAKKYKLYNKYKNQVQETELIDRGEEETAAELTTPETKEGSFPGKESSEEHNTKSHRRSGLSYQAKELKTPSSAPPPSIQTTAKLVVNVPVVHHEQPISATLADEKSHMDEELDETVKQSLDFETSRRIKLQERQEALRRKEINSTVGNASIYNLSWVSCYLSINDKQ
jgi:hypothetical protein